MSGVLLYDTDLITPYETLTHGALFINELGRIEAVGSQESFSAIPQDTKRLRLTGKRILPGLIDVHVHGGYGVDFCFGDFQKGLKEYSRQIVESGVTGYLLSIYAQTADGLVKMITEYVHILERESFAGAQPLGLHLEGPFLNPEKKGAFNPTWLRLPNLDEAKRYLDAGKGWIKQITIAPDLPQADQVAALFRQAGVVVAMGHTNADYATATRALQGSYNHVTHTFNAQRSFDHREPGVFGAILASDLATTELIADTIHVHPAAMRILGRCVGADRIVLITDAIAGAGLLDGDYDQMEFHIKIVNGKATLPNGTLAGSTAKLSDCVNNVAQAMQFPFHKVAQMASLNPARMLGLADERGSLAAGKRADLTVLDDSGKVCLTMVAGEIVYNRL
jgi:N-acetylglucosamine-6-phosphate deacetylase